MEQNFLRMESDLEVKKVRRLLSISIQHYREDGAGGGCTLLRKRLTVTTDNADYITHHSLTEESA